MSISFTVRTTIPKSLANIAKKLKALPQEAYDEFKKNTPVKTGNARNKTRLAQNTVKADYKYAGVLDKGRHMTNRGMRGSKQAPEGMSKPTVKYLKKRVKDIVRGK